MATAEDVLNVARGELGYDRYQDPETGTKYGRWYAQDHGEYFGTTGVPYCVMFASWCLDRAGVSCDGIPAASSSAVLAYANVGSVADIKPGDIVMFDFDASAGNGPDHTAICEENTGWSIKSIDGNVGNGRVLRRERAYSYVAGAVRPAYDGVDGGSRTDTDSADTDTESLVLDCDLGTVTVGAWARQLGLSGSDADGYISRQYTGNKQYLASFSSCIYNWYSGCSGSPTAKAIQRKVGSTNVDGVLGKVDVENIQRWLNETFGYHMVVDGVCGPTTAYNIQHSINKGFWA